MFRRIFLLLALIAPCISARAQPESKEDTLLRSRVDQQQAEISSLDAEVQSLSQRLGRKGNPLSKPESPPAPPPAPLPVPMVNPGPDANPVNVPASSGIPAPPQAVVRVARPVSETPDASPPAKPLAAPEQVSPAVPQPPPLPPSGAPGPSSPQVPGILAPPPPPPTAVETRSPVPPPFAPTPPPARPVETSPNRATPPSSPPVSSEAKKAQPGKAAASESATPPKTSQPAAKATAKPAALPPPVSPPEPPMLETKPATPSARVAKAEPVEVRKPPGTPSAGTHVIQSGETFSSISRATGFPVAELLKANPGVVPSRLQLGQELRLPDGKPSIVPPAATLPADTQAKKPAEPADSPKTTDTSKGGTHVIQSGDTLRSLARKYATTVDALLKCNEMINPQNMKIGTILKLPPGKAAVPAKEPKTEEHPPPVAQTPPREPSIPRPPTPGTYIVKPGDTLYFIAHQSGTPIEELRKVNRLENDTIHPGQSLKVRRGAPPTPDDPAPAKPAEPTAKSKTGAKPNTGKEKGKPGATAAPAPRPIAQSVDMGEYVVQPGDSVFSISRQFFLSREELASMNGIQKDTPLRDGQSLRLPAAAINAKQAAASDTGR